MSARRPLGVCVAAVGVLVALCGFAGAAPTTAGDLDPAFGTGGRVVLSPALQSAASAAAVQADGKVVLAGTIDDQAPPPPPPPAPYRAQASDADFFVARLTPDGNLDRGFGSAGVVRTPIDSGGAASDFAAAVAVGPDGRVVVAGLTVVPGGTDFAFVRYTPSGALDPTFSGDGVKTVHVGAFGGAEGVAVQPDGKVLAVGPGGDGFTVLRLRSNGDLDPTFGNGGVVNTSVGGSSRDQAAAVILIGARIVVAGTADMSDPRANAFAVVRYTPTGRLDPTFGSDGIVAGRGSYSQRAWALAPAPGNKIVVAGSDGSGAFRVARYLSSGVLDHAFGGSGTVTTSFGRVFAVAHGVAVQADGKVVSGGLALSDLPPGDQFAASRYNEDGTLDNSFGMGGKATYDPLATRLWGTGVVIQPGSDPAAAGRLVVAGKGSDGTSDHVIALGVDLGPLAPPPPASRVRCRVPRVIHLRYGIARRRIQRAHCSVGRVRVVHSSRKSWRRVVRQSPRAGVRLRQGARVNLTMGRR